MNNYLTLTDLSKVNYYGRNRVSAEKVTFLNSASGFEVKFSGKKLTAVFKRRGNGPVDQPQQTEPTLLRIRVYRDGDLNVENSSVIVLDQSTDGKDVTLAEFESAGEHTVLVRKMNYDWWGYIELLSLGCDGEFLTAPARPDKKILVYGDSITVGFGIEYAATGDTGGDCPEKEDGTRSYSVLFADGIGAEIQEYCNSGMSLGVPCWREFGIMDNDYYLQNAYFDTGSRYDMSDYAPDLIICNLGTNDCGGLVNGVSNFGNGTNYAPNDKYTSDYLQTKYSEFIDAMTRYYPGAPIVMMYGMLGNSPTVGEPISKAVELSGRRDVYYFPCNTVEYSENAGHPTLAGNIDALGQLRRFIRDNEIKF